MKIVEKSGTGLPHSKTLRGSDRFWTAAALCRSLIILVLLCSGCSDHAPTVTVYASQDQVYAEPILAEFTKKTGIRIRAVYDSEAVKTVGLVNRLIAERGNPQCDVFWNNEELRTRQLDRSGIVARWIAVGYRTRRIVINTNLVLTPPDSLIELTNASWTRKVALAYPMFGTTATHFLVLRQHWGSEPWEEWCRALQANQPLLVDGNSVVVQLVARGEAAIGLTDSDDVAAGQRQGLPIRALPFDETLIRIPNTIAVIRAAPHPKEARRLFDYLQSEPVLKALIAANALEGASPDGTGLNVDWNQLIDHLEQSTATLKSVFLR